MDLFWVKSMVECFANIGQEKCMNSPFNSNPLSVAREVQQMAQKTKGTDCEIFQKVALISMCVMAAAGTSQVLLQL